MITIPQISITTVPGRENIIQDSINAYFGVDCVNTIEISMINDKVNTYFVIFKQVDNKHDEFVRKFVRDLSDCVIIPHSTYKFVANALFYDNV